MKLVKAKRFGFFEDHVTEFAVQFTENVSTGGDDAVPSKACSLLEGSVIEGEIRNAEWRLCGTSTNSIISGRRRYVQMKGHLVRDDYTRPAS
mgnify:CR=1 FL=1